jgi:hypothetical protein
LKPFVSILNPSGRLGQAYWCCVYSANVSNKAYGLQLLVSVRHVGVELGLGVGRGTGGQLDAQADLQKELARAQGSVRRLRYSPTFKRIAAEVGNDGLVPRSEWYASPYSRPLASIEEWVDHASGPDGTGAAISGFWSRDEVLAMGETFFPRLVRELDHFSPVVDEIYSPVDRASG